MRGNTAPDLRVHTNYEYDFDLDGDTSAAAIVRFVAPNSRVLDIGAGSGSITRQLVRVKNCDVVAVENNPAAVLKLATFCKTVHNVDLNDEHWASQVVAQQNKLGLDADFDYVIAGDVLEHLYDPWSTARSMASLLNPKGRVIISVPHSGHSTVVAAFYNSDIDLRPSGILDKTHIRFFGLKNLDVLHAHAGLAVTDVHYVVRAPEETEFAASWRLLPENVRQLLSSRACADIYQVVTMAAKAATVKNPVQLSTSSRPASPGKRFWQKLSRRKPVV